MKKPYVTVPSVVTFLRALAVSAALLIANAPSAMAGPAPITLVVPFAPGGPTDRIAHAFADAVARQQPEQVIRIENVGGQGGTLGAARVARSPADGSVLLLQNIAMSAAPALYKDLPYDTLEDFVHIGMLQEVPMTLIGRNGLPATAAGLKRLLNDPSARRPVIAHAGTGSASHLCGLLFQRAWNVALDQKTYKGNAPATADLLSGNVDLLCDATTSAGIQVNARSVHAYAVTSAARLLQEPWRSVPTAREVGLKDAEISVWFALAAPKGTAEEDVARLNALLRRVVEDPAFVREQEALGAIVTRDARLTPAIHKRFVASQIQHWTETLRAPN
ncbi:tripartite tricarboxylate transporter substrate-binding protein [Piscinibacter gummiphilus]|uniref:Tripartite tricarboxylate transporter substrate-binding protein n=1 Tax=Piscinibacter gummiphilus TaxID=946333 RepID=A0ABZ0D217_9BURK|nr:tripartite tricarboxylate transporter substrate-binding protein [Piscinibacter gummiphilus]WOB11180.1 tripartite tricarboxylate transporter substrate-binding protein [Piscinibacter gummiphilus]